MRAMTGVLAGAALVAGLSAGAEARPCSAAEAACAPLVGFVCQRKGPADPDCAADYDRFAVCLERAAQSCPPSMGAEALRAACAGQPPRAGGAGAVGRLQVGYAHDGSCPSGQVRRLTGGWPERGLAAGSVCVPLGEVCR